MGTQTKLVNSQQSVSVTALIHYMRDRDRLEKRAKVHGPSNPCQRPDSGKMELDLGAALEKQCKEADDLSDFRGQTSLMQAKLSNGEFSLLLTLPSKIKIKCLGPDHNFVSAQQSARRLHHPCDHLRTHLELSLQLAIFSLLWCENYPYAGARNERTLLYMLHACDSLRHPPVHEPLLLAYNIFLTELIIN